MFIFKCQWRVQNGNDPLVFLDRLSWFLDRGRSTEGEIVVQVEESDKEK